MGIFDTLAHLVHSMLHQHVVGILAILRPLHHLAAVDIESANEFVAQHYPFLVVVEGEHYAHLVFEMGLHETVEETEVLLCAIGHGDCFEIAALDEGESVELSLGDVA